MSNIEFPLLEALETVHVSIFLYFFQLVIFGGMNDQKDFNDVCILQTRAALKHLPPEMTGMVWLWRYYVHVYVTSVNVTDNITTKRMPFYSVVIRRFHSENA